MSASKRPVGYINRVLVVEDDLHLADLLAEVLTYENCVAELASNGMEALEKLRGVDYEAIVCDLMMPRLDGEALYHQVVRDYPYLANRFLFVTGQAAHKSGFLSFVRGTRNTLLEKPFDVDQLRDALRELFTR